MKLKLSKYSTRNIKRPGLYIFTPFTEVYIVERLV